MFRVFVKVQMLPPRAVQSGKNWRALNLVNWSPERIGNGRCFGFLESADAAPKSHAKLKCLLESNLTNLLIELAVTIDAGESFVKATTP